LPLVSDAWRPTRLSVASWAVYDLANTIFSLGVGALYFAEWLTANADDLPTWLGRSGTPDLALALAINAAMVTVIVLGPWIGAVSDHSGTRVRFLIPATIIAVVPTFFLASVSVMASLALFSVALVGFNLGSVIYDAILPDVSTPETIGRVSGFGIGVGYLGSFIAVGVGILFLERLGHAGVFKIIAVAFLVLALPSFFFVRERPRPRWPGPAPSMRTSVRHLIQAWGRARGHRGVVRFLVGRFLYTDAVNTLIGGFLTIYVIEELGFSQGQVQALLGVAIVGALLGGFLGGLVVDRRGPRYLLHGVLYAWMVAMGLGVVAGALGIDVLAWLLGALGGLALGATWAGDRVYMQRISPPEHLGEFFGLYATVGRFATIVGPLMWGIVVTVLGFPREVALATLLLFVVAARIVLQKVDDAPRTWPPVDTAADSAPTLDA
jgi:MFS transporter, UMF1 family